MKDAVMSEMEENQPLEGPGKRLKALREAQELDLPRASSLLHLDESKLEALERDDYEKLPDSVFVRGYLKNYARLLNVPADQILPLYERIKPVEERKPMLQRSSVRHEVGSGHLLVRLMTWGIIIGLLVLAVLWLIGEFQWPLLSGTTDDPGDVITEADLPERTGLASLPEFSNQPNDEGGEGVLLLPALGDKPDSTQQESAAFPSDSEGGNRLALPETGTNTENGASGSSGLESTAGREAPPSSSAAPTGDVVIELIGDCWVNIKDAGGSFKIQNVLKQGTQRVLEGRPPYKIVLGKASAVRLKVKGKVIDLAPYTRGNVARLTLNPDNTDP